MGKIQARSIFRLVPLLAILVEFYRHLLSGCLIGQKNNKQTETYTNTSAKRQSSETPQGVDCHVKGTGVLVENFEKNPDRRGTKILFGGRGLKIFHV